MLRDIWDDLRKDKFFRRSSAFLLAILLTLMMLPEAEGAPPRTLPHDHSSLGKGGPLGDITFTGCINDNAGDCFVEFNNTSFNVRGTTADNTPGIRFLNPTGTQQGLLTGLSGALGNMQLRNLNNGAFVEIRADSTIGTDTQVATFSGDSGLNISTGLDLVITNGDFTQTGNMNVTGAIATIGTNDITSGDDILVGDLIRDTASSLHFLDLDEATDGGLELGHDIDVRVFFNNDNIGSGNFELTSQCSDEDVSACEIVWQIDNEGLLGGTTNLRAYKTATETVSSSTTLQLDNDLAVTLEDGHDYAFELFLSIDSPAAADFKFSIDCGSCTSVTSTYVCSAADGSGNAETFLHTTLSDTTNYATDGNANGISCQGHITNPTGGTGTYTVQWAQVTSNASATSVFFGSYWKLEKIN